MGLISDYMKEDHFVLDALFGSYRAAKRTDAALAHELFSHFAAGLEKHMACEEEVLFPLFEKKTGSSSLSGEASVLKIAHKRIVTLMKDITQALAHKRDTTALEEQLLATLKEHEKTEISIVYPWLDDVIDTETAQALMTDMKKFSITKKK